MLHLSWNAMNCTGLERSWLSWSEFLHHMLSGRQAPNHSIACASLETQHTEIRITTVILSDSGSEWKWERLTKIFWNMTMIYSKAEQYVQLGFTN